MLTRFAGAGLGAAIITTGLLFLMQLMIAQDKLVLNPSHDFVLKDVFWEGDPEIVVEPRPTKPEKIDTPPIEFPSPTGPTIGDPGGIDWVPETRPFTEGEGDPESRDFALNNMIATPRFRVPHKYPARAQSAGISGCVVYGFSITKTGATTDIHVIDSSRRVFDSAGMEAVAQYRYTPQSFNGLPVEVPGQSVRLVWEIEGQSLPDHPACR